MKRLTLLALASLWLAADARAASQIDAYYPEGPLLTDEGVLFAEMHKDRVVRWEGGKGHTFYKAPAGCGPTAIARYGAGFAVLCHLPDEVHLISASGERLSRLTADDQGLGFHNPNDATADDTGGVYFSASGTFSRFDQPKGALMYLDAGGTIHRVADKLTYSNGVHFDPRTRTLYLSEHLGTRVLSYPVLGPGRLGRPSVFKDFSKEHIEPINGFPLTGPDGLETDASGNLYVAIYGAGTLFILSSSGETLHRIEGQEPLITNIALVDGGKSLILTGSQIARRQPYPGSVRKIDNPIAK